MDSDYHYTHRIGSVGHSGYEAHAESPTSSQQRCINVHIEIHEMPFMHATSQSTATGSYVLALRAIEWAMAYNKLVS